MNDFINMQNKFVTRIDNAAKSNRLSHAYLIEGNSINQLEMAWKYIAKTICCDQESACHKCDACLKVDNDNLSDIIVYNLSDESLKKEMVLEIKERFSNTALEETNKQIYVIKYIENASQAALNSLLKFIEEPNENVYAIFTTRNISRVMPTIVSRSSCIRLEKVSVVEKMKVMNEEYNVDQVELVSKINNDEVQMKEILDSEFFIKFYDEITNVLKNISSKNFFSIMYDTFFDTNKDDLKYFFEFLYQMFLDKDTMALVIKDDELIEKLINNENIHLVIDLMINSRLALDSNVNSTLLLDRFTIEIERLYHESN